MRFEDVLRCPVCGAALRQEGNALACAGERRHCYDLASAGYVNLAPAKAAGGGDDSALIRARTAFLEKGYYRPVAETLCDLLRAYCPRGTVLDAGCGEGYYSLEMSRNGWDILGVDLSKRGVTHAAKAAKREGAAARFAVAGVFDLPVRDESCDAVVSLFAPIAEREFLRVLKPGGLLITAGAGPDHLLALKSVLYDIPYRNEPRADAPAQMALLAEKRLSYSVTLENAELQNLFAMTPYYYRTPEAGRRRLADTPSLAVGVDVAFSVYQK